MHPAHAQKILETHEARFWSKVEKRSDGGCWLWTGHRHPKGYGAYKAAGGGVVKAHREAYEMVNGPIPPGMIVCHTCDNPPCVNPAHLWTGTVAENNADRDAKGHQRTPTGSEHWAAQLTEADVVRIRERYAAGERQTAIASSMKISKSMVWSIIHRRAWAHVP